MPKMETSKPESETCDYYAWRFAAHGRMRQTDEIVEKFHTRCIELEKDKAALLKRATAAEVKVEDLNAKSDRLGAEIKHLRDSLEKPAVNDVPHV